jgi:integrase
MPTRAPSLTAPLNPHQAALLRSWAAGLSWSFIVQNYRPGCAASDVVQEVETLVAGLQAHARLYGRPELASALNGPPRKEAAWQAAAERAIDRIPRLTPPQPALADPLPRWFPPRLCAPLERTGLKTLGDVARAAALAGWWQPVPGFGAKAAATVRDFFAHHASLPPLQEAVLLAVDDTAAEGGMTVAPLERFVPPPPLDGRHRTNRREAAETNTRAATDAEAIAIWLRGFADSPGTWRAYRKEVERFWVWAVRVRQVAISDLTAEDLLAYREFLRDPQPADQWCGPRAPRTSSAWRPFQGGLSPHSRAHAETILRALYQGLVQLGYLARSPFQGVSRPRLRRAGRLREKAFTQHEWVWLQAFCEDRSGANHPGAGFYRHAHFALRFAFLTGLRISNLATARLGDIERRVEDDQVQWWLHAEVKGRKPLAVPVGNLLPDLVEYLRFRGYDAPLHTLDPQIPLIGKRCRPRDATGPREEPYTPSGLHRRLVRLFAEAAAAAPADVALRLDAFERASAHTLRHTHATHALDRGVPIKVVQFNLGHASLATTNLYVSEDERVRYGEIMGKVR